MVRDIDIWLRIDIELEISISYLGKDDEFGILVVVDWLRSDSERCMDL